MSIWQVHSGMRKPHFVPLGRRTDPIVHLFGNTNMDTEYRIQFLNWQGGMESAKKEKYI